MSSSNETNIASLEAIEAAGTALETSRKFANAVNQEKQAAAVLIPGAVDSLVDGRLVQDHERTNAMSKLGSHDGAVEVVGNLVQYIARQKAAYEQKLAVNGQGSGVAEKTASASGVGSGNGQPLNPNYIGQRAGQGVKKASDLAFINALGLTGQILDN